MDNNVKCEICGREMKTRINGSHLFRAHNITLDNYRKQFPASFIGKRTQKVQSYNCKICHDNVGSVQKLTSHLQLHNITPEKYFVDFILNGAVPMCKCGCNRPPSFISIQAGFHEYIAHHAPVWNKGLTKKADDRVNHMYNNRKTWNKGLTKTTNNTVKIISDKIQQAWNPTNISQRTASYKQCMMKKYGVKNGFQLESIKQKSKRTLLQKYGVENPQFSNECKFKWKIYTYPSGKTIKYQGYENFGIDLLLSEKYNENDIITDRKNIPKINYIDFNGKQRTHCPDIWLPTTNTLIEIKSNFTYNQHKQNIESKRFGAIEAGFNYKLLVFNDDGTINKYVNQ